MIGGCAAGMPSYIMTSVNFLSEPAFELLEFGKGNNTIENARKSQEYISKIVCEVTRYGNYIILIINVCF